MLSKSTDMKYTMVVSTNNFPYLEFNTLPPKQQTKKPRTHIWNMTMADIVHEAILNTSAN